MDFKWLKEMLKQRLIPHKEVLTEENMKVIEEHTVLYELKPVEIERAVLWSVTDENKMNIEEFKNACHDLYKANRNSYQQETKQKTNGNLSKEDQLVKYLEKITTKQLLEDLSSENEASERDLRVIRDIMLKQGLPSPVMNVLIYFILFQSDMKLSKVYMEKMASHWSRVNLKTAKDAMTFAKK